MKVRSLSISRQRGASLPQDFNFLHSMAVVHDLVDKPTSLLPSVPVTNWLYCTVDIQTGILEIVRYAGLMGILPNHFLSLPVVSPEVQ